LDIGHDDHLKWDGNPGHGNPWTFKYMCTCLHAGAINWIDTDCATLKNRGFEVHIVFITYEERKQIPVFIYSTCQGKFCEKKSWGYSVREHEAITQTHMKMVDDDI